MLQLCFFFSVSCIRVVVISRMPQDHQTLSTGRDGKIKLEKDSSLHLMLNRFFSLDSIYLVEDALISLLVWGFPLSGRASQWRILVLQVLRTRPKSSPENTPMLGIHNPYWILEAGSLWMSKWSKPFGKGTLNTRWMWCSQHLVHMVFSWWFDTHCADQWGEVAPAEFVQSPGSMSCDVFNHITNLISSCTHIWWFWTHFCT